MKSLCVFDAIVYHKVGRSIDTSSKQVLAGKIYLSYLNSFINLREYWPRPVWLVWRFAYFCYIIPMLKYRYRLTIGTIIKFVKSLSADSASIDIVDREKFSETIGRDFG